MCVYVHLCLYLHVCDCEHVCMCCMSVCVRVCTNMYACKSLQLFMWYVLILGARMYAHTFSKSLKRCDIVCVTDIGCTRVWQVYMHGRIAYVCARVYAYILKVSEKM